MENYGASKTLMAHNLCWLKSKLEINVILSDMIASNPVYKDLI